MKTYFIYIMKKVFEYVAGKWLVNKLITKNATDVSTSFGYCLPEISEMFPYTLVIIVELLVRAGGLPCEMV